MRCAYKVPAQHSGNAGQQVSVHLDPPIKINLISPTHFQECGLYHAGIQPEQGVIVGLKDTGQQVRLESKEGEGLDLPWLGRYSSTRFTTVL